MPGIYINCSILPFITWILAGRKRYETRTRNMLRALVGQRVALIETGNGPAMVRGYATICAPEYVPYDHVQARQRAKILGTPYDIPEGGRKVFYYLTDIKKCTPYPVPADRINHGRAWTEFTTTK